MKNKQSSTMMTLFFPGVFLGAVIGFIFGALLVAELADDATQTTATPAGAVEEAMYGGSMNAPGCTENATVVMETLDDTGLRHRLYHNREAIADVVTESPMAMSFFDTTVPGVTYIDFAPSGVGGYIPYAGASMVYRVDHCTGEATKVASRLDGGMITDISEDGAFAAFVSQGTAPALGIMPTVEAPDVVAVTWNVPGDYALIGEATISPDNTRIAFSVANGPDNEESEIMFLDTKTGVFTSVAKSNAILHVYGWNEDGTVSYRQ